MSAPPADSSRPLEPLRRHLPLVGAIVASGAGFYISQVTPAGPFVVYLAQIVLFVAMVFIVTTGGDWLVNSACAIAEHVGVSQLMIGLTVVAFGTSAPEGAVSLTAGFKGNGEITVANVVGSNIFNLCFILGSVALISRVGLPVRRELVYRDAVLLLGATMLLFLFVGGTNIHHAAANTGFGVPGLVLLNLRLDFLEGVALFGLLLLYLAHLYRVRKRDQRSTQFTYRPESQLHAASASAQGDQANEGHEPSESPTGSFVGDLGLFTLGLLLVVGGCHVLVGEAHVVDGVLSGYGAVWFAKTLNVSDYVVGVTIVAAGTSAPEMVVSLTSALKGRFDITIGNLLGSDLFNMLGVVGVAGIILQPPIGTPVVVSPAAIGSLLALIGLVGLTWIFLRTSMRLTRIEGLILVLIGVGRWVMDFAAQGV